MKNYKTLVAASLMSIALTSAAFAQCSDCALFPDRDVLNGGAPTPASKMGSGSAAGTQHRHYRDANASIGKRSAPADTPAHEMYLQNLRDAGYNAAKDFDGAGNMNTIN
jgi:hypothetical protein